MSKWKVLISFLGLTFLLPGGCSPISAAKVGYTAIKGASARLYTIEAVTGATLKEYQAIEVGEVTTDLKEVVSNYCLIAVENALEQAFMKDLGEVFPGNGDKKLAVDVVVRFFKEKPLLGKEARLDMLVTFVDAQGGNVQGKLYVEGFSNSISARGADELAAENADELVDYLLEQMGKKEKLLGMTAGGRFCGA
jgi:hypothetical protein